MKITNRYDMPQAFVRAVQKEFIYKPGYFRVTDMNKGIRECLLFRRHNENIEIDVSDMVWSVFGTAVHSVLSNGTELPAELKEQEISMQIGGGILVGHFDVLDLENMKLIDYKTGSVNKVLYNDWQDATNQIRTYASILSKAYGIYVKSGQIILFLKDHSKSKARFDKSYPQTPTCEYSFDIYPEDIECQIEIIGNRMAELIRCEQLPDEELPLCTEEERWSTPAKYAIKKKGRKTALKIFDTFEEASRYIFDSGVYDLSIETRERIDRKCMDYCMAKEFCPYWKAKYSIESVGKEEDYAE